MKSVFALSRMKSSKINAILRSRILLQMMTSSLISDQNTTHSNELQDSNIILNDIKISNVTEICIENKTSHENQIYTNVSNSNNSNINTADYFDETNMYLNQTENQTINTMLSATNNLNFNITNQIFKQGEINYYQSNNIDVSHSLLQKYKGRIVCINPKQYPHVDIYLCGTLHVAHSSVDMVKEAVQKLNPNYVVLELCESRIDSLEEHEELRNITLSQIIQNVLEQKTIKSLGVGLLSWMQLKAAKLMGSRLGGELAIAAREAYLKKATIVLGDRLYGVTIQRLFDQLNLFEKIKMVFIILWESLTMSIQKMKDYIRNTEKNNDFIKDEIAKFAKYMPIFANIIISERDEYLAQTICEIASVEIYNYFVSKYYIDKGFGKSVFHKNVEGVYYQKGVIIAVVGAGHLIGIEKHILSGGISYERLLNISTSSKHNSTWPGKGMLHVIDPTLLYNKS